MQRFAVVLVVLGIAGLAYATRTTPVQDTAQATQATLGPVQETDGWCVDVAVGAPTNLMASIPARITAAEQGKIRHLSVIHADDTDATAPLCVRLTDSTGMDCGANAGTSGRLGGVGQGLSFVIVPDTALAPPPAVYADAVGATITACVDVAW